MSEMTFAFELGRSAAKRRDAEQRDQPEPLLGGEFLDEWRRGYGGKGLPCPKKNNSTAGTAAGRSCELVSVPAATARASESPMVTKPKQATLFGETTEPKPTTSAVKPARRSIGGPMPVPLDEIEDEIAALVGIGIGVTEADELVRKQNWTLDAMVCQCKLGNEAGLPQHVIGRVARYGQQRWGGQ